MAEMTKEEADELAAWPENTVVAPWAPGEKAALTAVLEEIEVVLDTEPETTAVSNARTLINNVRLKYGLDTGADPDGKATSILLDAIYCRGAGRIEEAIALEEEAAPLLLKAKLTRLADTALAAVAIRAGRTSIAADERD